MLKHLHGWSIRAQRGPLTQANFLYDYGAQKKQFCVYSCQGGKFCHWALPPFNHVIQTHGLKPKEHFHLEISRHLRTLTSSYSPTVHACKSLQSCPTLCDPMDSSLPGPSVHRILQARILEWVAMPSSRESSQSRNRTCISVSPAWASGFFTTSTTWEAPVPWQNQDFLPGLTPKCS